jgi:hypothetical protein
MVFADLAHFTQLVTEPFARAGAAGASSDAADKM